jgi:hypothetical protein
VRLKFIRSLRGIKLLNQNSGVWHWRRRLSKSTSSIRFVEKVDKLLEIDLVIRLYSSDFDHGAHFIVCYLLTKYFKNFLEVLAAYVSLPITRED